MRRSVKDIFGAVLILVWMAILGWLLLLMTGCSPRVITVPEVHTEYVSKTDTFISVQKDFIHDSVLVERKGDTVFVDRWHTKIKDKDVIKIKTDTFLQRDSVPVPYPVKVEPTFRERAGTAAIWFVIGGIITFVIFVLRRK